MKRYNVSATSRASFAFYNTKDEIDVFIKALNKVIKISENFCDYTTHTPTLGCAYTETNKSNT